MVFRDILEIPFHSFEIHRSFFNMTTKIKYLNVITSVYERESEKKKKKKKKKVKISGHGNVRFL
jgi:hypothetical protein